MAFNLKSCKLLVEILSESAGTLNCTAFACSILNTESNPQLCNISVALLDHGEIVPALGAIYKL